MSGSEDVSLISRGFTSGLERILGEKLYGAYIYGAAVFPETIRTGDIDFHVILASEPAESEREELEVLHELLAERFPPLGGEMDGYYILLEDARRKAPPKSQMWAGAVDNAWALHREHILAGRRLVLYGPDPSEIYAPASWPELESALYDELAYVEKHLHIYPDYCILNLCRLMYSFETGNVVVSKAQSADWALDTLPGWSRLIELAMKSYAGQATAEDRNFMLDEVTTFFKFARKRIEEASD